MLVYDKNLDIRIHRMYRIGKTPMPKKCLEQYITCYTETCQWCLQGILNPSLGNESSKITLELQHIKPFDLTGRPMKGWVLVAKEGTNTDEKLEAWLYKTKIFAQNLPPKK